MSLANQLHCFIENTLIEIEAMLKSEDKRDWHHSLQSYIRKAGVGLDEIISDAGAKVVNGIIVERTPEPVSGNVTTAVTTESKPVVIYNFADIAKVYGVSERTASRRMAGKEPIKTVKRVAYFSLEDVMSAFDVEAAPAKKEAGIVSGNSIEKLMAAAGCRSEAELVDLLKYLTRE